LILPSARAAQDPVEVRENWLVSSLRKDFTLSIALSARRSLARTAQADWNQAAAASAGFACRSCFSSRTAAGAAAQLLGQPLRLCG